MMNDNILKIAPETNPFTRAKPSELVRRLNTLSLIGYEIAPFADSNIVTLHFKKSIKGIASPIMLLGNGDIATFDGWPFELDRIFIVTGDEIKFDRFIAGIKLKQEGWRSKSIDYLKYFGEILLFLLIATIAMYWLDK